MVQVHSAYFSFKVLPEATDPGYFSDIAVLSRTFVHENSFFQLMTLFGSIYYGPTTVPSILTSSAAATATAATSTTTDSTIANTVLHILSNVVEYSFIFYPYVIVRTWFPTTRFQNAGSSGRRTEKNERFYHYGTIAIKIFYLWATTMSKRSLTKHCK